MNSSADDFGDNPFRSSSTNNDVFFDASSSSQQQPPVADAFAPVSSSPAPPSGPMDNMHSMNTMSAGGSGMMPPPAPMQQSSMGAPAGLMSPLPPPQQQQYTQPPPVSLNPNQQQHQQQPTSWWGNMLLCLNLDTYKQYFNIDADDIVARIRGVFLHFYKPEYFRNNVLGTQNMSDLKGPDLYGPFWITMTLIFLIGVRDIFVHYELLTFGVSSSSFSAPSPRQFRSQILRDVYFSSFPFHTGHGQYASFPVAYNDGCRGRIRL